MFKKSKLKLWLPVVIWCVVIFSFSNMAINKEAAFSWVDFMIKKSAHVTEYAILFWLSLRAATNEFKKTDRKTLILTLAFCILYAFSDEWHQTFIPGREGTLRDVGFDTIGTLLSYSQLKKYL